MCAECRIYSHSVALSIPECARSAAHIYISLHWVFLNVRGVPRILTFYNTKHSWICAAPRTYSQSIAFSIPKYPEYARHPAHTHQFLRIVSPKCARHTAHIHLSALFILTMCAAHRAYSPVPQACIPQMCAAHRSYPSFCALHTHNVRGTPRILGVSSSILTKSLLRPHFSSPDSLNF